MKRNVTSRPQGYLLLLLAGRITMDYASGRVGGPPSPPAKAMASFERFVRRKADLGPLSIGDRHKFRAREMNGFCRPCVSHACVCYSTVCSRHAVLPPAR